MLESKVIQTRFEQEIFIDESSSIELSGFRSLENSSPFYEFMLGLDLIRIRDNEYYGTKKSYVRISISEDLQSLFVLEPDKQSIFAAKSEQEKKAAAELIQYLLIDSQKFKQVISKMINNLKKANVVCEMEIKELKAKLVVLERLLKVRDEDVTFTIRRENIA